MAEALKAAKIPINEIQINPKKLLSLQGSIESLVAADTELKYLAQKAFISYLRSIFLQKNKEIFNVNGKRPKLSINLSSLC